MKMELYITYKAYYSIVYLASFKRNNVHKKILLNVHAWVFKGKTVFIPS